MTRNLEPFRTSKSFHDTQLKEGLLEYAEEKVEKDQEREMMLDKKAKEIVDAFYIGGFVNDNLLYGVLFEYDQVLKNKIFEVWFAKNPEDCLLYLGNFETLPSFCQDRIGNFYLENGVDNLVDIDNLKRILEVFDIIVNSKLRELFLKRVDFSTLMLNKKKLPNISDEELLAKNWFDSRNFNWCGLVPFVDAFPNLDKQKIIEGVFNQTINSCPQILIQYREKFDISLRDLLNLFYERGLSESLTTVLDQIDLEHHQEIAEKAIEEGHSFSVLIRADKFKQVDPALLLEKIYAQKPGSSKNSINGFTLIYNNLDRIEGWLEYLSQEIVDEILKVSPESTARYVDKFGDKVDKAKLIELLFQQKEFLCLIKCSKQLGLSLDSAFALQIIDCGSDSVKVFVNNISKFEKLSRDVYLKLLSIDQSDAFRMISYFEGITKDEVYSAMRYQISYLGELGVLDTVKDFAGLGTLKLDTELANFLIEIRAFYALIEVFEKFEGLDHLDIVKRIISKGELSRVLKNISKFTGIEGTFFLQQCIFDTKSVREAVSLPVPDEMLDDHFSHQENRTVDELIRIYNVFACFDYYQKLLSHLEKDPSVKEKQGVIGIVTVMGIRDREDAQKYTAHKNKLLSFAHDKSALVKGALGNSFSKLAQSGDTDLLQYLTSIIRERTKSSKKDEESVGFLGLTSVQEVALRTLLRLNNFTANENLMSLLFVEDIDPRVKEYILRHLVTKRQGFLFVQMESWIRRELDKKGENFSFEELKYVFSTLKIPNADLREKSLILCNQAFEDFFQRESLFVGIHKEQCPEVPDNMLLPLLQLTKDSPKLLEDFNELYKKVKSNSEREALLLGVVNVLSIHSVLLERLVGKLENLGVAKEKNTKDLSTILKTLSFICTVDNYDNRDVLASIDNSDSLVTLSNLLKEIAVEKIKKVLPSSNISAEQIQMLWEHWGTLEPIFTYAAKMRNESEETLGLISEIVSHMDPPEYEEWKRWRYDMENTIVAEQMSALTEEQLDIWKENYFAELGDVMVATTPADKPKQVTGFLNGALAQGHIYNPNINGSNAHKFVQEEFQKTHDLIEKEPEKGEVFLLESIGRLQEDISQIDNLIRFGNLSKLEQALSLFGEGKMVAVNTKTKNFIASLEQFLSKEKFQEIDDAYKKAEQKGKPVLAETILHRDLYVALQNRVEEIKKAFAETLETDIFEKYHLDKEQSRNIGQFFKKRQELKALLDLYRLSNLDAKKIAMNSISDREDKKGETLKKVVESLIVYFKDTPAFVQDLTNIQSVIEEKVEAGGKRRLAMITTDDPQMLLQAGKYPLGCGSCQNYEGSSEWNKALAAYVADAHIKVSFLIDLNKLPEEIREQIDLRGFEEVKADIPPQYLLEASIARSINKLVKTEKGNPAIFMEPTYSSVNKGDLGMDRYFNIFLELMLAKPMGIRLVRGEGKLTVTVPESRNPSGQYEDCAAGNAGHAGMGIQHGSYTMRARFVDRFSPVTDADRKLAERIASSERW